MMKSLYEEFGGTYTLDRGFRSGYNELEKNIDIEQLQFEGYSLSTYTNAENGSWNCFFL